MRVDRPVWAGSFLQHFYVTHNQAYVRIKNVHFSFEFFDATRDIATAVESMPEFYERPHDSDVYPDRNGTMQDASKHGDSLFREDHRQIFGMCTPF